jgi:hypothetical protein
MLFLCTIKLIIFQTMNPISQLNKMYLSCISDHVSADTTHAMMRQIIIDLLEKGYLFFEENLSPVHFAIFASDRQTKQLIGDWEASILRKELAISARNFQMVSHYKEAGLGYLRELVNKTGHLAAARHVFFNLDHARKCVFVRFVPGSRGAHELRELITAYRIYNYVQ